MSSRWSGVMMLCAALLIAACGGKDGDDEQPKGNDPVDPPPIAERPLPVSGAPSDDESFEEIDYSKVITPEEEGPPGVEAEPKDVTCCPVRFAIADANAEQDEVYGRLEGSIAPLAEGALELAYADGVWSAEACIPPSTSGSYHYAFGVAGDAGEVFDYTVANPFAPNGFEGGLEVNLWTPASSCDELDLNVHARTSDEE